MEGRGNRVGVLRGRGRCFVIVETFYFLKSKRCWLEKSLGGKTHREAQLLKLSANSQGWQFST